VLTTKVERPLISVVDDDESVRESLPDLLREFGFAVRAFESARPRLIEEGAVECLLKPFSDTDLRKALDIALAED
jgi:FixJ family two-component response regulator